MKIREATLNDKVAWDSFVDNEDGSFYLYYDWKYIYEIRGRRYIPLMIENDSSRLVGIFPIVKEKRLLYSTLGSLPDGTSGGLLKKELSETEKYNAICALVKYIDSNYSRGCSTFYIRENVILTDKQSAVPPEALLDNGFIYSYDNSTGLPCTHVLELKQPFEEHIWKGLWTHDLRKQINKAIRDGVIVIEDRELNYAEHFIGMLTESYRRLKNKSPIIDETKVRFSIFKNKTKMFIALLNDQPIAGVLCHYTPSACYLAKIGSYEKNTGGASKLCNKTAIEDACSTGYRFADLGMSTSQSVAFFKEQFKFTRFTMGTYVKRYSNLRTFFQQVSIFLEYVRIDRMYLWHNRHRIWNKIIHTIVKKNR
jgi:hypothetical protein